MTDPFQITENNALRYFMSGYFYMPAEMKNKGGFRYTGEYKKEILLLVNDSMNSAHEALLRRIMQFAGLTDDDYALLTRDEFGASQVSLIIKVFAPKMILVWGETVFPHLPLFTISNIDSVPILCSIELKELDGNSGAKKSLAAALKELQSLHHE